MQLTRRHFSPEQKKFKRLNILFSGAFLILFTAYLAGVNELSIKNFEAVQKAKQAKQLEWQISRLEADAMALSSLNSLSPRVASLEMIKVDSVEYLNAKPIVAKRQSF